jgi:CHRD domain
MNFSTTTRTVLTGVILISAVTLGACNKSPSTPSSPTSNSPMTGNPSSNPSGTANVPPDLVVGTNVMATLGGSSEVPAVSGAGTGTFEARLDPATSMLKWTVTYSGLTGVPSAAHFHGPAMAGENAPPVVPVIGNLASPIVGVTTLTAAQIADLKAGKWYFNIHTAANPNGEIRGQLAAK